MSSDNTSPPPKATDFGGLYLPGDRIPSPDAMERNSDSAWAMFNELSAGQEARYAATEPAGLMHQTPAAAPVAASKPQITVDAVMLEARRNNRVCPLPLQWKALYELLPVRTGGDGRREPTPPIATVAAWRATPPLSKRMCLREQVEWAASHGCLEAVASFIFGMQEDEWHHMGE
jgi:hypothetical protein